MRARPRALTSSFCVRSLQAGAPKVTGAVPLSELPSAPITAGCWDPHNAGMVALAAGTSISIVDTRSMKCVFCFALFRPSAYDE